MPTPRTPDTPAPGKWKPSSGDERLQTEAVFAMQPAGTAEREVASPEAVTEKTGADEPPFDMPGETEPAAEFEIPIRSLAEQEAPPPASV